MTEEVRLEKEVRPAPSKKFDKKKWVNRKLKALNQMQNKAKARAIKDRVLSH